MRPNPSSAAPRVAVYVDGTNYLISKRYLVPEIEVDVPTLARRLAAEVGGELAGMKFYTAPTPHGGARRDQERSFFRRLRSSGVVQLILGRHEARYDEDGVRYYVEKETDVNLSVDMVADAYQDAFDVMVFVGADTDMVRAIEQVRNTGKHVVWARFSEQRHPLLAALVEEEIDFSEDFLRSCERPKLDRMPQPIGEGWRAERVAPARSHSR